MVRKKSGDYHLYSLKTKKPVDIPKQQSSAKNPHNLSKFNHLATKAKKKKLLQSSLKFAPSKNPVPSRQLIHNSCV